MNLKDEILRLSNTDVDDPIATLELKVLLPNGKNEEQQIRIGCPVLVETLYVCQLQNIGPIRMSSLCVGDNSFQALNMALAVVRDALHKSVNELNYQLQYGSEKEMNLDFLDSVIFADDYIKNCEIRISQK